MAPIRTFIAIALTGEVRLWVARLIDDLRPRAQGIRWASPENLHLTLRFLGDVEEGRISGVARAVSAAAAGEGPFVIRPGAVGAFPTLHRPRVLWVGVEGEVERLGRLQGRIEDELGGRGFPGEDRPFSPHLTIGRATRDRPVSVSLPPAPTEVPPEMVVREVLVLKSDLRPGGPVYTPLARIELNA